VKASNSCDRTLIFGSFLLLPLVKIFSLPLFRLFDLAFYCLFSFFWFDFLSPFIFPFFFALVLYIFLVHVVSSLAYSNLLRNKRLGCGCCWNMLLNLWTVYAFQGYPASGVSASQIQGHPNMQSVPQCASQVIAWTFYSVCYCNWG
jgi:hypothetical protein